ncbi:MAG: hypothetical protein MI700_01995 [Balneolales bacterium]|nr:hypothetical protein [Balneolales bacterium]
MFILLWAIFLGMPVQAQISINDLPPEEFYDFWVGEWDASWDEPEGKKGKGVNVITKDLDQKVIRESFQILEGQSAGFKGTSISVYQPQFNRWKQAWADNNGGYYDFTGDVDGEQRIFKTQIFELEDGRKFTQRMVFKEITENSMTWDWEASEDGGETWTLNWRIFYTRK